LYKDLQPLNLYFLYVAKALKHYIKQLPDQESC
jgi:hypothetical protein